MQNASVNPCFRWLIVYNFEYLQVPKKSNPRANCDLDDWMELESKNPDFRRPFISSNLSKSPQEEALRLEKRFHILDLDRAGSISIGEIVCEYELRRDSFSEKGNFEFGLVCSNYLSQQIDLIIST